MEDLNIEEVKQLLNFYRQKAVDLEFQVLQLQIKLNRAMSEQEVSKPATKVTKNKINSQE